jgi:hypothetical protein
MWIDDLANLTLRGKEDGAPRPATRPVTRPATKPADGPNPVQLVRLRLYVPIPQLEERFGDDAAGPLSTYIKTLEKRASDVLAVEKPPAAKGLLIAVGIKSKSRTRVWCEAVDGEVPAEVLRRLEAELAKVEAVDLKKGPAGFAMEVKLFGQKPSEYPEFPATWVEAAKKGEMKLLIPPDELFKTIWPD